MVLRTYLTVLAVKKSHLNFPMYTMLIVAAKLLIIMLLGHMLCERVCSHNNRDFRKQSKSI